MRDVALPFLRCPTQKRIAPTQIYDVGLGVTFQILDTPLRAHYYAVNGAKIDDTCPGLTPCETTVCGPAGSSRGNHGGDRGATESFLNNCRERSVEYDVIGQSYYPWWHGSLENLRDNLAFMANEYKKDIILVEVAYNWCPAEYRKEPGPFPETPEGQRQFLAEVDRIVRATPHGRGKGIFWWEPAVANSPIASRGMFDHDGNVLPVITVFDSLRVAGPAAGE